MQGAQCRKSFDLRPSSFIPVPSRASPFRPSMPDEGHAADGFGLLRDKVGVVFGALDESSLAWQIALAVQREGGRMLFSNAPVTKRFGQLDTLAEAVGGAPIVYADATNDEELGEVFRQARAHFGRPCDFVVHSIGMGLNVRKGRPYDELNYDWYLKSLDISAVSLHRIVRAGLTADAIADGGSIVALSFV